MITSFQPPHSHKAHTRLFQRCGFSPALHWPEMAQGGMSSMDPCVHLHPLPERLNSPQTQTPPVTPVCLADRKTPWEKPGSKAAIGSGDPLPIASEWRNSQRSGKSLQALSPAGMVLSLLQPGVGSHLFSLPEFQDHTENCEIPTCGQPTLQHCWGSHSGPVMSGTSLFRQPSYPHLQTLEAWILPLWHPKGFH